MSEIIIHAGAPKTGTSFLQVLFAQNQARLLEQGIYYPDGHMFEEAVKGNVTSGNGIELAKFISNDLPHDIPNLESYLASFEAILSENAGKKVLFSSEFFRLRGTEGMDQIKAAAQKFGFKFRVIFCVRDIVPAAFSAFSQRIKRHGEVRLFDEFIQTWDPQYALRIRETESSLGADTLEVYNYDEHKTNLPKLFFQDILGTNISFEKPKVVNRSLTPEEAEVVRTFNGFAPNDGRISSYVSDALLELPKPKSDGFKLTRRETEILEERFSRSLDVINSQIIGRPVVIEQSKIDERPSTEMSPTEAVFASVLAKLIRSQKPKK